MVTSVDSSQPLDLSNLLDRVERGERFVISRQGREIAELVPRQPAVRARPLAEVIAEMKADRDRRPPVSREEIRQMIDEGRR
jgi:prevent-host-death family protein